ncbi:tax1-binding protein 1 homolog B-like isoform X2 [Saccostrea echinata]|uniref:tax1-binding protein 1 homolog B-like isoform X2 n=1 Tax=Saccostrea echinata TaxID=191078 RepID=UPI002A81A478|nr:tax1-binding protein 1 homolog B-like isoform X2 [Saccostrea echinata]
MADFEEMDTINPIFDLVVFRSIKDITSGLETLPVTYDLGLDFHPHTNDWVGLFYSGWSSVKDYLEYRWAPMLPHNLNTVHRRRRSVIFQVSSFADVREEDTDFCFLYITRDNHVVGVSNNFRFQSLPGYEDDLHFDGLEKRAQEDSSFTFLTMEPGFECDNQCDDQFYFIPNRKRGLEDSFEMLNNDPPPQKRRSTKERVMIRTSDPDTLVSLSTDQWQNIFRIVSEKSIVKKVNGDLIVSQSPEVEPIFDISKKPLSITWHPSLPLTYEHKLAILPSPRSVFSVLSRNSMSCAACAMGKSLIQDLIVQHTKSEKSIRKMSEQIKVLKEEDLQLRQRLQKTLAEYEAGRQNMYHLEELFVQNQELEEKIRTMEFQMESLRAENAEVKDHQVSRDEENSRDQEVLKLLKEGFQGVLEINGRTLKIKVEDTKDVSSHEEWKMYIPKRMERMRKTINKQSITITSLTNTVIRQRDRMSNQSQRMLDIKKNLKVVTQMKEETDTKLVEVTQRIRSLLKDRAKCFTNEWRQFARKLTTGPLQEKEPKNRVLTSLMRSPPNQDITSRKSRKPERKCETCGIAFSSAVDPRVIEEHLAFHVTYQKKRD